MLLFPITQPILFFSPSSACQIAATDVRAYTEKYERTWYLRYIRIVLPNVVGYSQRNPIWDSETTIWPREWNIRIRMLRTRSGKNWSRLIQRVSWFIVVFSHEHDSPDKVKDTRDEGDAFGNPQINRNMQLQSLCTRNLHGISFKH